MVDLTRLRAQGVQIPEKRVAKARKTVAAGKVALAVGAGAVQAAAPAALADLKPAAVAAAQGALQEARVEYNRDGGAAARSRLHEVAEAAEREAAEQEVAEKKAKADVAAEEVRRKAQQVARTAGDEAVWRAEEEEAQREEEAEQAVRRAVDAESSAQKLREAEEAVARTILAAVPGSPAVEQGTTVEPLRLQRGRRSLASVDVAATTAQSIACATCVVAGLAASCTHRLPLENPRGPLPLGWEERQSQQYAGRAYFLNFATGVSQWERPRPRSPPSPQLSAARVAWAAHHERRCSSGRHDDGLVGQLRALKAALDTGALGSVDFAAAKAKLIAQHRGAPGAEHWLPVTARPVASERVAAALLRETRDPTMAATLAPERAAARLRLGARGSGRAPAGRGRESLHVAGLRERPLQVSFLLSSSRSKRCWQGTIVVYVT
jgi:hypothetical protein